MEAHLQWEQGDPMSSPVVDGTCNVLMHSVFVLIDKNNLPSPATIATTIDVDVEELCTSTVTSTPIIRPATGLLSISFSAKALPAALPPRRRNAELRKLNEQMKR